MTCISMEQFGSMCGDSKGKTVECGCQMWRPTPPYILRKDRSNKDLGVVLQRLANLAAGFAVELLV